MIFQVLKKSQILETTHSLNIYLNIILCDQIFAGYSGTEKEFAVNAVILKANDS